MDEPAFACGFMKLRNRDRSSIGSELPTFNRMVEGSSPSGPTTQMRKSREEFNAYMRVYMLNRYHERRKLWVERLGGKCSACGSDKDLEFDHIDPAKKKLAVSEKWSSNDNDILCELNKCQLLCRSCHEAKSKSDLKKITNERIARTNPLVHGARGYWRGCRCDVCREGAREHKKQKRSKPS